MAQVPNEEQEESAEWFYRERVKVLEARVTQLEDSLRRIVLERDHWFESAKIGEKSILNLAQALNRDPQ